MAFSYGNMLPLPLPLLHDFVVVVDVVVGGGDGGGGIPPELIENDIHEADLTTLLRNQTTRIYSSS